MLFVNYIEWLFISSDRKIKTYFSLTVCGAISRNKHNGNKIALRFFAFLTHIFCSTFKSYVCCCYFVCFDFFKSISNKNERVKTISLNICMWMCLYKCNGIKLHLLAICHIFTFLLVCFCHACNTIIFIHSSETPWRYKVN